MFVNVKKKYNYVIQYSHSNVGNFKIKVLAGRLCKDQTIITTFVLFHYVYCFYFIFFLTNINK